MFNWLFKKKAPSQGAKNLFLVLELEPTGKVVPYAHLGDPESEEEATNLSQGMALLAFMLSEGQFLALLQQGIAQAGERQGLDGVATAALQAINRLIAAKAKMDEESQLCVPPDKAFNPLPSGAISDD